jgi:hypothetical protein
MELIVRKLMRNFLYNTQAGNHQGSLKQNKIVLAVFDTFKLHETNIGTVGAK